MLISAVSESRGANAADIPKGASLCAANTAPSSHGEQRISVAASHEHTVPRYRAADYSRRGGNLGRQLGGRRKVLRGGTVDRAGNGHNKADDGAQDEVPMIQMWSWWKGLARRRAARLVSRFQTCSDVCCREAWHTPEGRNQSANTRGARSFYEWLRNLSNFFPQHMRSPSREAIAKMLERSKI